MLRILGVQGFDLCRSHIAIHNTAHVHVRALFRKVPSNRDFARYADQNLQFLPIVKFSLYFWID